MNADTTQKNPLLSLAQTDLDAAQAEYDAACRAYQWSHSHIDKQAMYAALEELQNVKRNYEQAYRLLAQHQFERAV